MPRSFGMSFADSIVKGKSSPRRFSLKDEDAGKGSRYFFFSFLLFIGIGVLLARICIVTLVEGGRYKKLGDENRIRETRIPAPRGIVYDRNGVPLVRNIPVFQFPDGTLYFEQKPKDKIDPGMVEYVTRDYIYSEKTAHTVGFVGEINQEELARRAKDQYRQGDYIGKMGVEQMYDETLRGTVGRQLAEVDALGVWVRRLGNVLPIPGKNIILTIDMALQETAAKTLAGKRGAIVASNPETGEILALYSSPSFDPNAFIRGGNVSAVFENPEQPLFDRGIAGLYPPGSTFKIVTAIAGLESRSLTPQTIVEDTGVLSVAGFTFGNWYFSQYGKTEGPVNLVKAIKRSNDIYFYKAGEMIGIETLAGWAKKLGVGAVNGIDIAGEVTGIMPDPAWMKREKNENWYLGNTYHVAIGQGDVLTSPLQVNAWTNVIANGGKLCRSYVARDGKEKKENCKDLEIGKDTIALIKEGMREACAEGGTGWPLFNFKIPASPAGGQNAKFKIDNVDYFDPPESTTSAALKDSVGIPIACKTGTAEFGHPKNKTHAWMTAFAPVVHPQISVTVLIEEGGEGSSVAGPVAKELFTAWFTMNGSP